MSTATARQTDLDLVEQQLEAARSRGDNVEVVRLWLKRATDLGTGFRRATSEPARIDVAPMARHPLEMEVSRRSQSSHQVFAPSFQAEAALEPPTEVRMTWKLRRELQEEAAQMGDKREAGGFLWGRMYPHPLGRTTVVEITGFSHNRSDDDRTPESLLLSHAHIEEAFLRNPRVIGDWHTHVRRGSLAPSDQDLTVWGGRSQYVSWRSGRAPGYIGLVIGAEVGHNWLSAAMQLRAFFVPPLRWDVPLEQRDPKSIPIRED